MIIDRVSPNPVLATELGSPISRPLGEMRDFTALHFASLRHTGLFNHPNQLLRLPGGDRASLDPEQDEVLR
jgi:hypothetical protein